MDESRVPDALHIRSLSIQNVKAFSHRQELHLTDAQDKAGRWCLILGENGVGKTTLLQSIAAMRPIPGFEVEPGQTVGDAGVPDRSQPALSLSENEEMRRFARNVGRATMIMEASFESRTGDILDIAIELEFNDDSAIVGISITKAAYPLTAEGPLVIGYGAGRHVGHDNQLSVDERNATWSLFAEAADLYDAEEIIALLHHGSKTEGKFQERDTRRLGQVMSAVAALLPNVSVSDIVFRGPRLPKRKPEDCGVHVRLPTGTVPLTSLSLGYQAVFAWTVDLAYRLHVAYPDSENPLHEYAIVLIDEIDLHLHPRWQRGLREHLTAHFPNVQFIATTHSPVTAQEAISHGATVAVVRLDDDHAVIVNDPLPDRDWAFDQILTSELFGFDSSRGADAEKILKERVSLVRTLNRTAEQDARLAELDDAVDAMPSMRSDIEKEFDELMRALRRTLPADV